MDDAAKDLKRLEKRLGELRAGVTRALGSRLVFHEGKGALDGELANSSQVRRNGGNELLITLMKRLTGARMLRLPRRKPSSTTSSLTLRCLLFR